MIRKRVLSACLVLGLASVTIGAVADEVTPADAGPFLGQWTLALEGPNGPGTFDLSLAIESDKVVGEIGSAQMPTQKFTTISKAAKGLSLGFSFPYEGMTVDAVVSLIPAAEGKMDAGIDFAGGAYTMSGTATKKPAAE
jgi:hypothetical protein